MNAQAHTVEEDQDVRFFDVTPTPLVRLYQKNKITLPQMDAGKFAFDILAESLPPHVAVGSLDLGGRGTRSNPDGWSDYRLDKLINRSVDRLTSTLFSLKKESYTAFWNIVVKDQYLAATTEKIFGRQDGKLDKKTLGYLTEALDVICVEYGFY